MFSPLMKPVKSVENWMDKDEFRAILVHLFQFEEYACKEEQFIAVTGITINMSKKLIN